MTKVNEKIKEFEDNLNTIVRKFENISEDFKKKSTDIIIEYQNKLKEKETHFKLDELLLEDISSILKDTFYKFSTTYGSPLNKIFDNVLQNNSKKIEEIFTNTITNIFNSSEFIEQLLIQCRKKITESLISESQSVIIRKTQQLKQNPAFNAKMILAISELIDKKLKEYYEKSNN